MIRRCCRGFSLVELLVTLVAMGILTSTVYGLYLSTQKTASGQEEVVELQQNLRVAMDLLTREIRLAGFLVSSHHPPIASAPHHPQSEDTFALHTASPSGMSAYLGGDLRIEGVEEAVFRLARPEMVDLFAVDDPVRILRPQDQSQPIARLLRVAATNRAARTVTVDGFEPAADKAEYKVGDVLAVSSSTFPGTVSFYLKDHEIYRKHSDGNAQRVTSKRMRGSDLVTGITVFAMEYVMSDGDIREQVAIGDVDAIRAVRVTLEGVASSGEQTRQRSLSSVVSLRNRQGE